MINEKWLVLIAALGLIAWVWAIALWSIFGMTTEILYLGFAGFLTHLGMLKLIPKDK